MARSSVHKVNLEYAANARVPGQRGGREVVSHMRLRVLLVLVLLLWVQSAYARDAASELMERGIIRGYPDGGCHPGRVVSPPEALVMMARLNAYVALRIGRGDTKTSLDSVFIKALKFRRPKLECLYEH